MDLSEDRQNEYVSLVMEILEITQSENYLTNNSMRDNVNCLRDEIDQKVYSDLCLSEKEIQEIESIYREG